VYYWINFKNLLKKIHIYIYKFNCFQNLFEFTLVNKKIMIINKLSIIYINLICSTSFQIFYSWCRPSNILLVTLPASFQRFQAFKTFYSWHRFSIFYSHYYIHTSHNLSFQILIKTLNLEISILNFLYISM